MPSYLFPPIGGFGNPSQPWVAPEQFPEIDLIAHKGKAHLLEAQPKDLVTGLTFRAYGPAGGLDRPSWTVRGQKVYIHPAATLSRSSRGEDSPSNTWVPGVMQPTLNYGRSLWSGADPMNITSPASGVIDLQDNNGRLEYLLNYSWDTAPIVIKRGYTDTLFATWGIVGRFAGANIVGDMNKKTIRLRDIGWKLNVLLHNEYYAGTGGREGGSGLANVWKPYTIGYCFNVSPVQVDSPRQIWQWSFTSSEALDECRHGGTVLDFHADYATYELLAAAVDALAIPDGYYGTCLAESMVAVSLDITRSIRLDVQGDNSTQLGHTTPTTRAEIVRRIATCYGESYLNDTTEIDVSSFTTLDQDHSAICGYFFSREIKKDEALTKIMSGILGFWHVTPLGQLSIGYAKIPESSDSIQDIEFQSYGMGLIQMIDFVPPRAKTQIGWRENYGPETIDQLSPGVDQTFAVILGNESRFESAGDGGVVSVYPTAPTVKLQGGFWNQADALAEAIRQDSVMGKVRRRYRWTMEIDAFADILNRVMTITNVNRLFLGASKPLLCVSVDSRGFGTVTTEWWG
jgi:hypothetical protein